MKVCLVIIYYNEYKYLQSLLTSLSKQTVIPDKIIFVDNCSTEDPLPIITQYPNLNIDYMRLNENMFFTRGINIGLRKALKENYDIIGCMNSDMWCDINMVEAIIKHFIDNSNVVALTPNIRNLENTKDVFCPLKYKGIFQKAVPQPSIESSTDFLIGASLFVRSSVLQKTGLFYEPYFHGTEDFEMSDKLKKYGILKYIYSTNIHHRDVDIPKATSLEFEKINSKNWYIYCLRNKPSNLILIKLALFKNIVGTLKGNTIDKQRLFGKLEGIKETFFHLTNKNKYL